MIKPENFSEVAEKLASNPNDEASLRTAISRYYYAAFLKIRLEFKLQLENIRDDIEGIYNYIMDNESKNPHKFYIILISLKNKFIAQILYALRYLRNVSDYDIHKNVTFKHAQASGDYSKLIISRTNQIIPEIIKDIMNQKIEFLNKLNTILWQSKNLFENFQTFLKGFHFD